MRGSSRLIILGYGVRQPMQDVRSDTLQVTLCVCSGTLLGADQIRGARNDEHFNIIFGVRFALIRFDSICRIARLSVTFRRANAALVGAFGLATIYDRPLSISSVPTTVNHSLDSLLAELLAELLLADRFVDQLIGLN